MSYPGVSLFVGGAWGPAAGARIRDSDCGSEGGLEAIGNDLVTEFVSQAGR